MGTCGRGAGGGGESKDRDGSATRARRPPGCSPPHQPALGRPPSSEARPAPCPARPCRLLRGGGVGVGDEDPLLALRRTEPSLGLLGVSWLHPRTPAPRKGSRASAGGGARLSGSPLRPPRPAPRSPPRPPQWPRPRANPHDLPSRWEQHKESTFHAPHQAHAERLRVLKNSL